MSMGFKDMPVRFFAYCTDGEGEQSFFELEEEQFKELGGNISYECHTVFENGVRQICLTTDASIEG